MAVDLLWSRACTQSKFTPAVFWFNWMRELTDLGVSKVEGSDPATYLGMYVSLVVTSLSNGKLLTCPIRYTSLKERKCKYDLRPNSMFTRPKIMVRSKYRVSF